MVHSASDPVESLDLVSLLIGAGIALRGQYDAQRREIMPFEPRIRSVGHGAEDIDDIALQARQHDLGFGIAETSVELDHLDPLRSLHQTAVQHPFERTPFGDHRIGRRLQDPFERIPLILRRNERQRGIGPHTARVGPLVAVEGALVVLRQRHRPHLAARHEAHERKFGSRKEVLDHDLAFAELVVEQHVFQCGVGLFQRLGDHHALAGRQPVVLQHRRKRTRSHVIQRFGILRESAVPRRRNSVFGHQVLGELLARFDPRGGFRRAEDPQPGGLERIDDSRRQRHLRPHDRKVDFVGRCEVAQSLHLGLLDRHALGLRRNARIAGGAPDFLHLRRACEGVYDRMFTAAAAYYQNFHIRLFYPFFQRNFKKYPCFFHR